MVVLHEDTLHQSFAAAFLNRLKLPTRGQPAFRRANNKAGVIRDFPIELKAVLSASGGETHLIVMIDADGKTRQQVRDQLLASLSSGERLEAEQCTRWLVVSPAWELENWVRCLSGEAVDETRKPEYRLAKDSDCRPAARTLAEYCRTQDTIPNALSSLQDACANWTEYMALNRL